MLSPNKVTGANSRPASQFESRGLRRCALVAASHGRQHGGAAVADMADGLSRGKRGAIADSASASAFGEGGQEVTGWRRVRYLPGGWYADIRELPGGLLRAGSPGLDSPRPGPQSRLGSYPRREYPITTSRVGHRTQPHHLMSTLTLIWSSNDSLLTVEGTLSFNDSAEMIVALLLGPVAADNRFACLRHGSGGKPRRRR